MNNDNEFDVIIVGGSYSGLAAGMALGRALRKVLIFDSGKACNRQTPHSHNFLTQDGKTPKDIADLARQQVQMYNTVAFFEGEATSAIKTENHFQVEASSGEKFTAKKLVLATGIKDIMPGIPGFAECWGITAIHCPYCHGYEVRGQKTGIVANGEYGFEFSLLISNWTKDLTLYTNGRSTLTIEQTSKLEKHKIRIEEEEIKQLEHIDGHIENIILRDGRREPIKALYSRIPFVQHCTIPEKLGCELNSDGYIKVDPSQGTTVPGVFACGDNTTRMRTLANAVATGTIAGMMVNKALVEEPAML